MKEAKVACILDGMRTSVDHASLGKTARLICYLTLEKPVLDHQRQERKRGEGVLSYPNSKNGVDHRRCQHQMAKRTVGSLGDPFEEKLRSWIKLLWIRYQHVSLAYVDALSYASYGAFICLSSRE